MHLLRLNPDLPRDFEIASSLVESSPDYMLKQFGRFATSDLVHRLAHGAPPGCRPEDQLLFAFCDKGVPLGLAQIWRYFPDPSAATIGLLLVTNEGRRQHVGCKFVEQLSRQARNWEGIGRWSLAVLEGNEAALRFWQHCGFGNLRSGIAAPGLTGQAMLMERTLKGRPQCKTGARSAESAEQLLAQRWFAARR